MTMTMDGRAVVEFQIPTEVDGLLATEANVFSVATDINVTKLSDFTLIEMIQEIHVAFQDGTEINENKAFDLLYSVSRKFSAMKAQVKKKTFSCLIMGFQCFMRTLGEEIENISVGTSHALLLQNCAKMYAFLLNTIAVQEEAEAARATKHLTMSTTTATKKKSSKGAAASKDFQWADERDKALGFLLNLLKMDVAKLWPMSCAEEPFVNLITRFAYIVLENPDAVKAASTLSVITNLLGLMNQKYNHASACATSLVHLLPHFPHLSSPVAEMLNTFATEFSCTSLATDVLREIGRIEPADFVNDVSGARAFSVFLTDMGATMPDVCLASLSFLLPHLDGEAYPIRNGILRLCGGVLQHTLRVATSQQLQQHQQQQRVGDGEDASEKASHVDAQSMKSSRDELIVIVKERLIDVSAYVRKTALQVWQQLALSKSIPLTSLNSVVQACLERLEDKSSLVRKQAIAFLTAMLTNNPYGDKLDIGAFESLLTEATEKLAELTKALEEAGTRSGSEEATEGAGEEHVGEEECDEVKKLRVVIKYYTDAVVFTRAVEDAVPVVAQLLGSKTVSDVVEAISCLVTAAEFNIRSSDLGMRKMLALVWNKETAVQQAVLDAYKHLYFQPDPSIYPSKKEQHMVVVKNMLHLLRGANLADRASFKELVGVMMKESVLEKGVFKHLLDIAAHRMHSIKYSHMCAAVAILGMAAAVDTSIIKDNVGLILSICRHTSTPTAEDEKEEEADISNSQDNEDEPSGQGDEKEQQQQQQSVLLLKECAIALRALTGNKRVTSRTIPKRFPSDHAMFGTLLQVLLEMATASVTCFTEAAEEVINTVYKLAEHPDALVGAFLKRFHAAILPASTGSADETGAIPLAVRLTRLVAIVGHTAMKQLVHLDFIQLEMKRRRALEEDLRTQANEKKKATEEDEAEEMGVGGANADDIEADFITNICENELIAPHALLGQYTGLVLGICGNPSAFADERLQTAATLALAKFMCVSTEFCDTHLQLLFTVLETSPFPSVRANAIVALGDLAFRFPNLIEPWTDHLYARLRDESDFVRKNAVMVLTHLILNDMVKVKGQIAGMAVCIEDPNPRIADLSRLFFLELSHKGNAIYNILPDVIAHVSHIGVPYDKMCSIMTYLFDFIKKERHAESLVEKLCQRFRATREASHWRNFAHCLTLLNYSDRCIRKLADQFPCYKDKLGDQQVYDSFAAILSKAAKFAKPEMKEALAVLAEKIGSAHATGAQREEAEAAAVAVSKKHGRGMKKGKKGVQSATEASLNDITAEVEVLSLSTKKADTGASSSRKAKATTTSARAAGRMVSSARKVGKKLSDKAPAAAVKKATRRRRAVVESEEDDSDISELDIGSDGEEGESLTDDRDILDFSSSDDDSDVDALEEVTTARKEKGKKNRQHQQQRPKRSGKGKATQPLQEMNASFDGEDPLLSL